MTEFKKALKPLTEKITRYPWADKAFYAEYLAQTHYYTFHSCKMLAYAAALATKEQGAYYTRLISHLKEESGHDVIAAVDLKNMGSRLEDHPEDGVTRALYEPQYHKIVQSPTSLLGYVLALEMTCVETFADVHRQVKAAHGEKCSSFVRVHAEDDPDHVEKAVQQLSALSAREQRLVLENFEQTCLMVVAWFERLSVLAGARSEIRPSTNRAA